MWSLFIWVMVLWSVWSIMYLMYDNNLTGTYDNLKRFEIFYEIVKYADILVERTYIVCLSNHFANYLSNWIMFVEQCKAKPTSPYVKLEVPASSKYHYISHLYWCMPIYIYIYIYCKHLSQTFMLILFLIPLYLFIMNSFE